MSSHNHMPPVPPAASLFIGGGIVDVDAIGTVIVIDVDGVGTVIVMDGAGMLGMVVGEDVDMLVVVDGMVMDGIAVDMLPDVSAPASTKS